MNTDSASSSRRDDKAFNELDLLLEKIRRVDFAEYANSLRPGHTPISLGIPDDASKLRRGGMNVHIPLTFSDGLKWLARVRQQSTPSTQFIIDSEIATMQMLKEAGLQVPNAFAPQNSRGSLHFFVIEYLEGIACNAPIATGSLTVQQQHDLIDSIASFYINLSRISFTKVGSVVRTESENVEIGPLISPDFYRDPENGPPFFGPFKSSAHRYLAQIGHVLHQIEEGQAFTNDAVQAYVTHLWLRDLLKSTVWEEEAAREGEPTYLKHADDKGDQILVNTNGNFVGMIDWEWAYTASKSEAFAAPLALVDVSAFFDGNNSLSSNENRLMDAYTKLGYPDLAACVREGKVYQRLPMVVGQTPDLVQLRALEQALTDHQNSERQEETIEEWVASMISGRYSEVAALKKLNT